VIREALSLPQGGVAVLKVHQGTIMQVEFYTYSNGRISFRTQWNEFALINESDVGLHVLMMSHIIEGTITISFYGL
jgi:hypothetical protein